MQQHGINILRLAYITHKENLTEQGSINWIVLFRKIYIDSRG